MVFRKYWQFQRSKNLVLYSQARVICYTEFHRSSTEDHGVLLAGSLIINHKEHEGHKGLAKKISPKLHRGEHREAQSF